VVEAQCVFSAKGTEILNILYLSFTLKGFMFLVNLLVSLSLFRKHKFMFVHRCHVASFRIKISYNIIGVFYALSNIICIRRIAQLLTSQNLKYFELVSCYLSLTKLHVPKFISILVTQV
jgi:hypothetical protein